MFSRAYILFIILGCYISSGAHTIPKELRNHGNINGLGVCTYAVNKQMTSYLLCASTYVYFITNLIETSLSRAELTKVMQQCH